MRSHKETLLCTFKYIDISSIVWLTMNAQHFPLYKLSCLVLGRLKEQQRVLVAYGVNNIAQVSFFN